MTEAEKAWRAMDDWCRRRGAFLGESATRLLDKGADLDDREYRRLLGASQAYGQMRSFIHSNRDYLKEQ